MATAKVVQITGTFKFGKMANQSGHVVALGSEVIRKVFCGHAHSCALTETSHVITWGDNKYGQLGRGRDCSVTPTLVKELSSHVVVQLVCGSNHCMALTDDSKIYGWGQNNYGQLGLDEKLDQVTTPQPIKCLEELGFSQIAAGGFHNMALTVSGALFAWGKNKFGQLGLGENKVHRFPTLVKSLRNQKVKFVACGEDHSAILTKNGRVFTFGSGMYGQLGHDSTQSEKLPKMVRKLMGSVITQISCGRVNTLAYELSTGRIYSFGLGDGGQLGLGSYNKCLSPTTIKGPFVAHGPTRLAESAEPDEDADNEQYVVDQIYAGGDHCFVTVSSPDADRSPTDFRQICPDSQILRISNETLEKLSSISMDEGRQMMTKIFSSAGCMNASFLTADDQHYNCSSQNHGLDLDVAVEFFEKVQQMSFFYRSINLDLATSPPDVESLRLYLFLPWYNNQIDNRIYFRMLHGFANSVIRLDDNPSKILDIWWSMLQPRHFISYVKIFKRLVVHNLELTTPLSINETVYSCMNILRRLNRHDCTEQGLMGLSTATRESKDDLFIQGYTGVQDANRSRLNIFMEENGMLGEEPTVLEINHAKGEIIPYENFYIPELMDLIDLKQQYIERVMQDDLPVLSVLRSDTEKRGAYSRLSGQSMCWYPFAFDARAKAFLVKFDTFIQRQGSVRHTEVLRSLAFPFVTVPVRPFLLLVIDRANIVQSTLQHLTNYHNMDFKKPLKVVFANEDAVDEGGVQKEFFLLLLKEILNPGFGMFRYYEDSRLNWFTESTYADNDYFKMFGILCGLAVYNGVLIELNFPLSAYKKLLEKPVTMEDLKQLGPTVGKSLDQLLDYEDDDVEEAFGLTFELTSEVYGKLKQIELLPEHSDTPVNKSNRQQYVDAYIDYVFNKSIEDKFRDFYAGFHEVCGGIVLRMFRPQELEALVVGNDHYNWDEFETNTEYRGEYSRDHPTIQVFWEVFKDISIQDKKAFLLFLTGSDRIPMTGMKDVKITIQSTDKADDFLPVAHTCFNLLDLPKYESKEMLRDKLLEAIQYTQGFGLK